MAALTGTDKQIAWAEKIQAEIIEQMQSGLRVAEGGRGGGPSAPQSAIDAWNERLDRKVVWMQAAIDGAEAEASASWWIDNRSQPIDVFYTRFAGPRPR